LKPGSLEEGPHLGVLFDHRCKPVSDFIIQQIDFVMWN